MILSDIILVLIYQRPTKKKNLFGNKKHWRQLITRDGGFLKAMDQFPAITPNLIILTAWHAVFLAYFLWQSLPKLTGANGFQNQF